MDLTFTIDEQINITKDPKEIRPLTVTKNGTYEADFYGGYSPVTVDVPRSIKHIFDITGGYANYMFAQKGRRFTSTKGLYLYDDFLNVTNVQNMFLGSSELKDVQAFDARNVQYFEGFLSHVKALEEVWITNVKANLIVGSGTSYGHLLTLESLIHLIYQLRDTGEPKTLTVGSVNLEKLANVYVRTIDITDEMRAEDDLIDEKLPFEVCERTDEGACLITDYALAKNWEIQ